MAPTNINTLIKEAGLFGPLLKALPGKANAGMRRAFGQAARGFKPGAIAGAGAGFLMPEQKYDNNGNPIKATMRDRFGSAISGGLMGGALGAAGNVYRNLPGFKTASEEGELNMDNPNKLIKIAKDNGLSALDPQEIVKLAREQRRKNKEAGFVGTYLPYLLGAGGLAYGAKKLSDGVKGFADAGLGKLNDKIKGMPFNQQPPTGPVN